MKYASNAMTAAKFKGAVSSIKTRSGNLQKDIHAACVAAMIFSATETVGGDKNATPALQLVQSLSDGMPRNKVVNWLHYFTNVRITATKDKKTGAMSWSVKNLSPSHEEYSEIDEEAIGHAINLPYWQLMPEADIKEVDIQALLAKVLKRVNAAKEAGRLKANPANEQRIAALAAMCKTAE